MLNIEEHILEKRSLFITGYKGDLVEIDRQIKILKEKDKGRVLSNRGGYQSNNITSGFEELVKYVHRVVIRSHSNKKIELDNFWLNINKGNDSNNLHIHGFYTIAAVYYHKICCNKCPIIMEHLVPSIIEGYHSFNPNNQSIIVFDGMTPHKVLSCGNTDHERISIAFNFKIL